MQTSPVQVQKFLKDINYPVRKNDLIEHAKKKNASIEVLQDIAKLPDKEYTNAADVSREFKGS
jgi:hypothetical protein